MSKSATQALQLLKLSEEVYSVDKLPNFELEFPYLFKELGLVKEKYKIELKKDAIPTCIYTPRNVPQPLLSKVKEKLEVMVCQNVITPVIFPTDWFSSMVVTPR